MSNLGEGMPVFKKSENSNEEMNSSTIDLHFLRHSIKSKDKYEDDRMVPLTEAGAQLAKDNAYQDVNLAQAVAFGSDRIRAQQTAGLAMAGVHDEIVGNETPEELKEKLKNGNTFGKIAVDDRLDFKDDESTPLGKKFTEALGQGKYLKFTIEDSDRLAKELGDTSGAHYSRKAADVAQVVEKYLKVAPRWNKLVNEKKIDGTNEQKYQQTLERYLGTHQGMQESFLAKLIEKTEGLAKRDAFVQVLGDKGFDYMEGFETKIVTKSTGESTLFVSYESKDKSFVFKREIPVSMVQEIIAEGLK